MNPISRVTMYDALTMLTSGFLLCVAFFPLCGKSCWCLEVLFWIICYVVGLVFHRLLDELAVLGWDCMRNNECIMRKSRRNALEINLKRSLEISERRKDICKKVRRFICRMICRRKAWMRLKKQSIKGEYYKAYYTLIKKNSLGNIPALEVQVAFMRNMVWIVGFYLLGSFFCDFWIYKIFDCFWIDRCCGRLVLLAFMAILIVVRYISQYKICVLVWEGACFMRDDNTGNNNNDANVNPQ